MMSLGDLFVQVYVLIDDAIRSGALAVRPRPGPSPPARRSPCASPAPSADHPPALGSPPPVRRACP
jgi:hypothetical protein